MNIAVRDQEFNGIVISQSDGRITTTSRDIAEKFGKAHKRVLQSIRELDCSPEFSQHHFVHTPYVDEQNGQTYQMYNITLEGFMFLAMGFTGKTAAAWKEKFIAAFNAMAAHIRQSGGFHIPANLPDALRLAAQQAEQIEEMKPKAAALDLLEGSDGAQVPRVASKALGVPERKFFQWLHAHNWAFRQGKTWQGYSEKIKQGSLHRWRITNAVWASKWRERACSPA